MLHGSIVKKDLFVADSLALTSTIEEISLFLNAINICQVQTEALHQKRFLFTKSKWKVWSHQTKIDNESSSRSFIQSKSTISVVKRAYNFIWFSNIQFSMPQINLKLKRRKRQAEALSTLIFFLVSFSSSLCLFASWSVWVEERGKAMWNFKRISEDDETFSRFTAKIILFFPLKLQGPHESWRFSSMFH